MVKVLIVVALFLANGSIGFAQKAASETARYHRLIAVVHMVGSGKQADPVRPEYVPDKPSRQGILAWSVQYSDDNKYALVHFVAVNRDAFASILSDKRPDVKVFEIGRHKKEDIEKELKKLKKDFTLDTFQVVAQ